MFDLMNRVLATFKLPRILPAKLHFQSFSILGHFWSSISNYPGCAKRPSPFSLTVASALDCLMMIFLHYLHPQLLSFLTLLLIWQYEINNNLSFRHILLGELLDGGDVAGTPFERGTPLL